jgi:hypothetical protein
MNTVGETFCLNLNTFMQIIDELKLNDERVSENEI